MKILDLFYLLIFLYSHLALNLLHLKMQTAAIGAAVCIF